MLTHLCLSDLCLGRFWFSRDCLWCFNPDRAWQGGHLQTVPPSLGTHPFKWKHLQGRSHPQLWPLLPVVKPPDTSSCHVWPLLGTPRVVPMLGDPTYQALLPIYPQPHSEPPGELAPQVSGRPLYPGATQRLLGVPWSEHGCDSCPSQLPGEASAPGGQRDLTFGLLGGSDFPKQPWSRLFYSPHW